MCVDVSLSVLLPNQYQHSHRAVSQRREHFNRLLSILLSILIKGSFHVCGCESAGVWVHYRVTDQCQKEEHILSDCSQYILLSI